MYVKDFKMTLIKYSYEFSHQDIYFRIIWIHNIATVYSFKGLKTSLFNELEKCTCRRGISETVTRRSKTLTTSNIYRKKDPLNNYLFNYELVYCN